MYGKRKYVSDTVNKSVKRVKDSAKLARMVNAANRIGRAYRDYRSHTKGLRNQKMAPKLSHTRAIAGAKRKFVGRKTRPIENNLKGVNKKFVAKVQKVINNNESWGEYMHIGNKQLRQIDRDEYQIESTDEFNTAFVLDSNYSIENAAAILWNSKDSVNNVEDRTLLLDKGTPIKVLHSQIEFFFKSTSSHVVNLELFECTSKTQDSNAADANAWAQTTFDDYEFTIRRDTAATSNLISRYGVEPRHFTSLHQRFNVKVHKVKLGPGEYSYLKIRGMKKTYDRSQMQGAGADTNRFSRGSKSFFFRIINDVTCSTSINRIHAWPSNSRGGVAMRYQTTYRIAPPKMTPIGNVTTLPPAFLPVTRVRNVVKIHQSYNSETDSNDQQVTYYNPPGTTTTDI